MNPEDVKRYTFRLVPTIRKNPFSQDNYYKFSEYVEEGLPVLPETEMDCTEAQSVIAMIKAKL